MLCPNKKDTPKTGTRTEGKKSFEKHPKEVDKPQNIV